MSTYASDPGGKDYDPVPEGSHLAVCDMFVDLGLQQSKFGAKPKIYIRWQIPSKRVTYERDGVAIDQPMAIGATYTLSLAEKSNLRPMLQSWRGRAFTPDELKKFDVTTIVGKPCMITVTHEPKDGGGIYANVGVVAKLPDGVAAPTLEGETIIYDADNVDSWDSLRPWMREKIQAQVVLEQEIPEQRGAANPSDLDDDVPF